jgi:glycosyltransferase involved in cell wall biosynthesis
MQNIAILSLDDFENWNNKKSLSMGGTAGVIKSILPSIVGDNIYLIGLTSNRALLYKESRLNDNIIIVPIVYVPNKTHLPTRFFAFWYGRKINNILNKYKITSVYTHAEEISFWIQPGFNILYHMHGSTNALEKAKNKLFRNILFKKIWSYIRNKTIKKANNIIAIDQLCYNLVKSQMMHRKAHIITNFVDTNIFFKENSPSKTIKHINGKILLFVGRIEEVKGLELFVDTLIELNNIDSGLWKGVFVGRGTNEPNLMSYISGKNAIDHFQFAGAVFEQDELRRIYNQASALMISSHFEGIPMVILESIACGTPVFSTNVGGIKEFIADDEICFVNDKRDPSEFARLIKLNTKPYLYSTEDFKYSTQKAALLINSMLGGYINTK